LTPVVLSCTDESTFADVPSREVPDLIEQLTLRCQSAFELLLGLTGLRSFVNTVIIEHFLQGVGARETRGGRGNLREGELYVLLVVAEHAGAVFLA
jgi:hypothetical protein